MWQNFPALQVLNLPNPARIDGASAWNETTGDNSNTLTTKGIPDDELCTKANATGRNCKAAISRNRTMPLSYPGRLGG